MLREIHDNMIDVCRIEQKCTRIVLMSKEQRVGFMVIL